MQKNVTDIFTPVSLQAIGRIHGQEDFVEFLRTELSWPIPLRIDRLEDVSIPQDLQRDFGFSPSEDRIQVSRLLNLSEDQPWGIFLFEFKTRKPYLSHLRRMLRVLGSRRTLQRGDPIWNRNDLLFICTQDWMEYQFVHFSGERPEIAVISSFGWKGPQDRFLHTLCKHNLPRLRMPEPDMDGSYSAETWRAQWREAFNIKPVTDEFYATLKEVFHAVESGIGGLKGEQRRAFTELLINRLIFLKFVEKKGWLNRDTDYLYRQFQKYSGGRYWKDFLFHLFFEGLNTEPRQRTESAGRVLGDVPYLNAELFALSDQWDDRQVSVEGRSLDLLFDKLLNPYNFTVAETSPLEVEVAFNQDLLGYAYEELIADQHGQGAYYTHPTEVNLMCRESLRAYMDERCPQVGKEAIARLVYGELEQASSAPAIPLDHAISLYSALHDVTVCDPAIGSGTFPVAMVKHLFTCLRTLGGLLKEYAPFKELIDQAALTDWRKGYELKLHIIERSIYGCDIDYFAVQLAKLRFWVELMVECEQPVPLPNFDFKLLVGDALLSVVGSDRGGGPISLEEMWGHPTRQSGKINLSIELARKYAEKKKTYYSIHDPNGRLHLRKELLADRETLIRSALQFSRPAYQRTDKHVLWQIDFAELFIGDHPGFDIVLANPPYLRQELIDSSFRDFGLLANKATLRNIYNELIGIKVKGTADLYLYFYLRSIMLAHQRNGVICFICSNSWLDVEFGEDLQQAILDNTSQFIIFDSQIARSFQSAAINTSITVLVTGKCHGENFIANFVLLKDTFENSTNLNNWLQMDRKKIGVTHFNSYRINTTRKSDLSIGNQTAGNWGGRFLRAPDIYFDILNRCGRKLIALSGLADLRFGVKTGANEFFHLSEETIREWEIEPEFLKPVVRSLRECKSYIVNPNDLKYKILECKKDKRQLKGTNVLRYISWGEEQGFNNRPSCKGRGRWYDYGEQQPSDFIMLRFRDLRNWTPLILDESYIVGDTVFVGSFLSRNIKSIAGAILNSTFIVFISEIYGRVNLGDGLLTTYGPELTKFLIPNPEIIKPLEKEVVDAFTAMASRDVLPIFEEINMEDRQRLDRIIFRGLGLSEAEMNELYRATIEMVNNRISKASSV